MFVGKIEVLIILTGVCITHNNCERQSAQRGQVKVCRCLSSYACV